MIREREREIERERDRERERKTESKRKRHGLTGPGKKEQIYIISRAIFCYKV